MIKNLNYVWGSWGDSHIWLRNSEGILRKQELGEGATMAAGTEDALKRRCVVMLELSATLARVLEFVTARLPRAFLEGPPLNMARLAETACFVVAHMAAPTAAASAIAAVLASRFLAAQNAKRAVLLAPVLGASRNGMMVCART